MYKASCETPVLKSRRSYLKLAMMLFASASERPASMNRRLRALALAVMFPCVCAIIEANADSEAGKDSKSCGRGIGVGRLMRRYAQGLSETQASLISTSRSIDLLQHFGH